MRMTPLAGCPRWAHIIRLLLPLLLFVVLADAVRLPQLSPWHRLPSYPLGVFEAGGSVLGHPRAGWELVVFGGFSGFPAVTRRVYSLRLHESSLVQSRWTRLSDMPEPLTHMAQASRGRYFFGAGGYRGRFPGPSSRSVFRYDVLMNRWMRLPSLPSARAGGGLVYVHHRGKRLLVYAGGVERDEQGHVHDRGDTWTLDLGALGRGWVDVDEEMPKRRNHLGAVFACGRLLWVGGQRLLDEDHGNSRAVAEYLPDERKWTSRSVTRLPFPLSHISASVLPFRCGVLIVGGIGTGRRVSRAVLYWEPRTNRWFRVGFFPKAVATPVCGIVDRTLVCATGEGGVKRDVFATTLSMRQFKFLGLQ